MPIGHYSLALAGAAMTLLSLGRTHVAAESASFGGVNLANATSWTYQLQGIDLDALSAAAGDLLVTDYSSDGTDAGAFSASEIAKLKHRPGGQRRIVLAYLSIGEAEDYRFYWKPGWRDAPPAWLTAENADWPGNFGVRYWDRGWQELILGRPQGYLDRIQRAGFDGVYLDRIDAYDAPDGAMSKSARMRSMADFVAALTAEARTQIPGFVVVAQNAEELLAFEGYRDVIDGLAKEDLFYGLAGDGNPNSTSEVAASLDLIVPLQMAGKPLFLAEYLNNPNQIAAARARAASLGAPLFIGGRELDSAQSR